MSPPADKPTAEGILRYPPDGRYIANDPAGACCTCRPACDEPCEGDCGCKACSMAFNDFGYDE